MTQRRAARGTAGQDVQDGPQGGYASRGGLPDASKVFPGIRQKRAGSRQSSGDALSAVYDALSEKEFQAIVVDGLRQRGYLVWTVPDMRKTTRGLPDIIAVHPIRLPRRVLFWELKGTKTRVRPEQKAALAALSDVYGVDARVLRPADWPDALEEV